MIRRTRAKIVLYVLIVTICLCRGSALSQQDTDVGAHDPFMPLSNARQNPEPRSVETEPEEEKPELFIETVNLRFLNAANMQAVIENMSSEYGSVAADEKSNSLIICDTKETIAKILEQVKKADMALSQVMFVKTVTLRFLDAQSVKNAIDGMSSEYGNLSIDLKNNSLIIRDTSTTLERITEEIEKIDKPQQIMLVETVTLRFLEAKNLKEAMEKMLSPYGTIAVDENTNSLIVCDTEGGVKKIVAEIIKADTAPEQIMIEVVIVDVQLDDDTEIGVNWDSVFPNKRHHDYQQSLISTLATTGVIGADFTYVKSGINGTIHALQEIRNVEILASPHVLVLSGQQALIKTVEKIPYVELTGTAEGGSEALSSTQFEEAGITLIVKATVTADGKILMTIKPQQSAMTGETGVGSSTVPIIDRREAETTLLMEDGQVLVMGGMRKKETRHSRDQIPLLGDLPLVGILFANDNMVVQHHELLVFISPHIHRGKPLRDDQFERFNEIRNQPLLRLPDTKSKKNTDELLSIMSSLERNLSR